MAWILFGAGLVCGPYVLRRVPLPPILAGRKASLYLAGETVLILLALGINFLYCGVAPGSLRRLPPFSSACWLVFGPVFVRQLPLQGRRGLVYVAAGTGFLLLLLLAVCLENGGTWFRSAALWSVFGIALVCLPLVIGQYSLARAAGGGTRRCCIWEFCRSGWWSVCAADGWGLWFPPALPAGGAAVPGPALAVAGRYALPAHRTVVPAARPASWPRASGPIWHPWALDRISHGQRQSSPTSPILWPSRPNLFCWTDHRAGHRQRSGTDLPELRPGGPALPGDWPLAAGKEKTIKTAPRRSIEHAI